MEATMLAMFLGSGYVVRRLLDYQPESVIAFGLALIALTVTVEGLHEGLHKLVFGVGGISADIEWVELATIPHDQTVSAKLVFAALVMPGIVLTGLLLTGIYVSVEPAITAGLGFGLVLNLTLSVVDIFSLAPIAGERLDARIHFESTASGTLIRVLPSAETA
jgi:hypothetical protein